MNRAVGVADTTILKGERGTRTQWYDALEAHVYLLDYGKMLSERFLKGIG